jgi:hypothetical protein
MAANIIYFNREQIAALGEKIYREFYKDLYEQKYRGDFLAIDITNRKAYLDHTPESVLKRAVGANPEGIFHLIQVGFLGAFRMSHRSLSK